MDPTLAEQEQEQETGPATVAEASAPAATPLPEKQGRWRLPRVLLVIAAIALPMLLGLAWWIWAPAPMQFTDPSFDHPPPAGNTPKASTPMEPVKTEAPVPTPPPLPIAVQTAIEALQTAQAENQSKLDGWLSALRAGPAIEDRIGKLDDELRAVRATLDRTRATADEAAGKLTGLNADQSAARTRFADLEARIRAAVDLQRELRVDVDHQSEALKALETRLTAIETRLSPLPKPAAGRSKTRRSAPPQPVHARTSATAPVPVAAVEYRDGVPYAVTDDGVVVRLGSRYQGRTVQRSTDGGLQLMPAGAMP